MVSAGAAQQLASTETPSASSKTEGVRVIYVRSGDSIAFAKFRFNQGESDFCAHGISNVYPRLLNSVDSLRDGLEDLLNREFLTIRFDLEVKEA